MAVETGVVSVAKSFLEGIITGLAGAFLIEGFCSTSADLEAEVVAGAMRAKGFADAACND